MNTLDRTTPAHVPPQPPAPAPAELNCAALVQQSRTDWSQLAERWDGALTARQAT